MRRAIGLLMTTAALVLGPAGPSMAEGGGMLDGFVIGHVPGDAGERVSDAEYEPEDGLRFSSRTWERALPGGGHSVDLFIVVMRGDRLSTPATLRDFMSEYHGRDPASWREIRVGEHPGHRDDKRVFWLVEPGVAISVTINPDRFGERDLLAVANGIRPQ